MLSLPSGSTPNMEMPGANCGDNIDPGEVCLLSLHTAATLGARQTFPSPPQANRRLRREATHLPPPLILLYRGEPTVGQTVLWGDSYIPGCLIWGMDQVSWGSWSQQPGTMWVDVIPTGGRRRCWLGASITPWEVQIGTVESWEGRGAGSCTTWDAG